MTIPADLATLQALDWHTIGCQCPIHDCHHQATQVVEIHAIDACNQPGLNPFGNRVELRCPECVLGLWLEVADKLTWLYVATRGEPVQCDGCGAPIACVPDVIRGVTKL